MKRESIDFTNLNQIEDTIPLEEILLGSDTDEVIVPKQYLDPRELSKGDKLMLFGEVAFDQYIVVESTSLGKPLTARYSAKYRRTNKPTTPQYFNPEEEARHIIMGSCDGVNQEYGSAIDPLEDGLHLYRYPWLLHIKNETQVTEMTSNSPILFMGIVYSN
ncbi:MAG: hypothetical protein WD432_00330 [Candidatus Saccharimonadales bacterium]